MSNYIDKNGVNRDPELIRRRSKHVGEVLGGQYILDRVTGVSKQNVTLYDIRCLKCGHVYTDARIPDINRKLKNKEGCKHGVDHVSYNRWKVPRIGDTYNHMKARCYSPSSNRYYLYGARGITICDEWLKDPSAFEEWALVNGYQDTYSINRKDSSKGYSPDNCEWIPLSDNSKFDKSNVTTFYVGDSRYSSADIDRMFNLRLGYTHVYFQKNGYEKTVLWIDDLINGRIPAPDPYSHTRFIDVDGCYCMSVTDWAKYLGLVYSTVYLHCTNYDELHMRRFLRSMILDRIGVINLYGTSVTLSQISMVTNLRIDWLREGYINYGAPFLLDAMRHNGCIVIDPSKKGMKRDANSIK